MGGEVGGFVDSVSTFYSVFNERLRFKFAKSLRRCQNSFSNVFLQVRNTANQNFLMKFQSKLLERECENWCIE